MKVYKFPVEHYAQITAHIADAEDLCFRRMLDLYMTTERPLPLDMGELCEATNMDDDVVRYVLDEFFIKTAHGYRNPMADDIVARFTHRKTLNQEIAKRPRKKRLQVANG